MLNLNQYRRAVRVFNNRKLPLKKMYDPTLQKNILKTQIIEILIFLRVLTVRYAISLSSAQNIRFLCQSLFHSLYFISVVSYIHHADSRWKMDWKKCAFCQQDDKNLIDFSKNKDPASCGYSKLATNIDPFTQNSLTLPAKLTVSRDNLAGSSDIATSLHDNGAKCCKGCAIELSLSKMQRALNCREKGKVNVEMETPSKKTRTNVSAKSPLGSNTCLFYDLPGTLSEEDPLCRTNKLTKEMKSK